MTRKTALSLIMLCLMLPLSAAAVPVVTLDEAIASAEENSIDLESARVMLGQALRNQKAVMTTFMPSISLDAGLSTGASFPGADGSAYGGGTLSETAFSGLSVTAGATASFTFDGPMITDNESRRLSGEAASLDFQSTWAGLEEAVTEAYWNISASAASVENAKASLEDARKLGTIDELLCNIPGLSLCRPVSSIGIQGMRDGINRHDPDPVISAGKSPHMHNLLCSKMIIENLQVIIR